MIFINNKYTTIYYQIIEKARSKNIKTKKEAKSILGYVERHHIIPKSIGGLDKKDNLIFLTGREHFICHWLLVKMTSGRCHEKMVHALLMMRNKTAQQDRYTTLITSRVYEKYKIIDSSIKSRQYTGNVKNKTLYKFCHVDGRIEVNSILGMAQKYNIPRYSIAHLIKKPAGKHHVKGWSVDVPMKSSDRSELYTGTGGPTYDNTIFTFRHNTGILEYCTKYELFTKYKLKRDGIYYICSGKQKSSQGWSISHKSGN
jgi:hypothetical protein